LDVPVYIYSFEVYEPFVRLMTARFESKVHFLIFLSLKDLNILSAIILHVVCFINTRSISQLYNLDETYTYIDIPSRRLIELYVRYCHGK